MLWNIFIFHFCITIKFNIYTIEAKDDFLSFFSLIFHKFQFQLKIGYLIKINIQSSILIWFVFIPISKSIIFFLGKSKLCMTCIEFFYWEFFELFGFIFVFLVFWKDFSFFCLLSEWILKKLCIIILGI